MRPLAPVHMPNLLCQERAKIIRKILHKETNHKWCIALKMDCKVKHYFTYELRWQPLTGPQSFRKSPKYPLF